jgi:FlaA1/EpsC-like NDP-sugar epimerase
MKAISKRRLHRHQWRIFKVIAMVLLDATLVATSFQLAHFIRYNVLFKNHFLVYLRHNIENSSLPHTADIFTPLSGFLGLEISIVIGLITIFAFRGLYNIRLTGSLLRQVWTIASSATVGLAFLITYFFIFQPPSSSRLLVPFVWAVTIIVLSLGRMIVSAAMGLLYRIGLGGNTAAGRWFGASREDDDAAYSCQS